LQSGRVTTAFRLAQYPKLRVAAQTRGIGLSVLSYLRAVNPTQVGEPVIFDQMADSRCPNKMQQCAHSVHHGGRSEPEGEFMISASRETKLLEFGRKTPIHCARR
jgi:hypothetical protein